MPNRESKTIVITGATRGLGRALCEGFIRLGHTVAGCGRDAGRVAELQSRCGSRHSFATVDVASDEAVAAWASTVLSRHGPPDLLLNNAAVINRNAPLWEISAGEFGAVIDVNLKGVAHVIRHFLPAMIRRGRGVIVNFSSGWGRSTSPEVAPYCATKWAIEGLTQALAAEVPSGLAVVALNPGIIDTDMLRSCFGRAARDYPGPEQWAQTAVPFLLGLGRQHNGRSLDVP
ncbi:MAG TPA: SDR family oxidoreductase [Methylomirabilota bacterium]|nr:SDR family oxidoreductase [Methylomirabilota bacterium]